MDKATKILIIMMMCITLVGCGKKKVEYTTDDTYVNTEEGAYENDVYDGDIPETVSYTVERGETSPEYVVDATVNANLDEVNIYDISFDDIDDNYVKNICSSVFDDGDYYVVRPYSSYNEDDFNIEHERLCSIGTDANGNYSYPVQQRLTYLECSMVDGYINNSNAQLSDEFIMQNYDTLTFDDYTGDVIGINVLREEGLSFDTSTVMCGTVRGKIDDSVYELNAWRYMEPYDAGSSGLVNQTEAYDDVYCWYTLTNLSNHIKVYQCKNMNDDNANLIYGDNRCDIFAAEKEAEDFMDKLGINNYMKYETYNIISDNEEVFYDGYCFVYELTIDGVEINVGSSSAIGYYEDEKSRGMYNSSKIKVYVNSEGVAFIAVLSPVKIGDKEMAGSLESFDEIDNNAKEYIGNSVVYNVNIDTTYNIYSIKLIYAITTEDMITYTLRPVWVYNGYIEPGSNGIYSLEGKYVAVAIDAITGDYLGGNAYLDMIASDIGGL